MEINFLSEGNKEIQAQIKKVCESSLEIVNDEDKGILNSILKELAQDKWSTIKHQELNFLKNHDESVWADYLIFRWKFKIYPALKKAPEFPLYLLVEPSSVCNIKCKMCFQSDESFSCNKDYMGVMDFDMFKKIIDEAAEGGTKAITFASRGEPLLNKKFGEMLQYSKGKFYEIKINTNAILLTEELCRTILDAEVGIVVFSVDAYDKETYEKIRNTDKFPQVLENIKRFHKIRKEEFPNAKVVTRAHGVKVEKDFDDKKFHEFWKDIADAVTMMECIERWNTYENKVNSITKPCQFSFDRLYIWYDGKYNPCDEDYKSYQSFGNFKETTIRKIWNGEKITKFREAHLNGERTKLTPCDRCEL